MQPSQLDLFDRTPAVPASDAPTGEPPRCRLCARPARWNPVQMRWGAYCGGRSCDNRDRICQCCGSPFVLNANGAGTKYCGADCKRDGYHPESPWPRCALCGVPASYRKAGGFWPYVCDDCMIPLNPVAQRLKAHHVPLERARLLLSDPGCEICGADLLAGTKPNGHGRLLPALVVDHDHRCCPTDTHSCGQCVRGLICATCNSGIGLLGDDAARVRAAADYLEARNGGMADDDRAA